MMTVKEKEIIRCNRAAKGGTFMKQSVKEESLQKLRWGLLAFLMSATVVTVSPFNSYAAGGLDLSTQYPGMSVKPGDNLNIPITLENTSGASLDADVSIVELPEGWEGYLQGGSYEVSRVHAENGDEGTQMTLHVTVPKEVEEGTYTAKVQASSGGAADELALSFQVKEIFGTKGSFSAEYPKQEGASGTDFSFSTTLINNGLKDQSYSLSANAPAGWTVEFTPSGDTTKVAGIDVKSGESKGINVSVKPAEGVAAGTYQIPCTATSAEETLNTELEVTITGTYGLQLQTPDGRLSFDAYAGRESDVTLNIVNTGNVDLQNISLNSNAPAGWTVTYNLEENIIQSLPAGSTSEVIAHVKPDSKAITGDYVTTFTASCDGATSSADFRVSVKTKTIWGLAAVAVIVATVGAIAYMFRRYGRR